MAAAASGDLYERRRAARQEVQSLKDRVKALKREKADDALAGCMKSKGEGEFLFEVRRILAGHYGKVYAMHWAADSQHLVSASQDGKLIVWDAMEQIRKYGVNLVSAWVMTCAFDQTAEGRTVASGGLDNTCSLYKLDMPGRLVKEPMLELTGHEGYLSCCRFVDGTSSILTSSGDWTCTLWDVEKAKNKQDFRGHTADVMFVALNPQRPNEFVSGSVDSTALIWDMRAGSKPQLSYIGHESDINAVAFMNNGYSFATGSDDYSCLLFDTRSKSQVARYAAPRSSGSSGLSINGGVYGLDFSKSGRVLFAAYEDGKAVAWETISKERVYHKIQHERREGDTDKKRMSGVGVSPDGKSVCTASWDTTLQVWA